jgi:TRAP transporter TAXI family solute receptor
VLGETIRHVAELVETGGRDDVRLRVYDPNKLVPTLQIFYAVAAGKLDAFFAVGGAPLRSLERLAEIAEVQILPVDAERLGLDGDDWSFTVPATLAAGTYEGVAETPTLATAALLLVRADLPSAVVRRMTARLWHAETRARLAEVHPQGGHLRPELAVRGLPVPLHPGAGGYYRELGLLP